MVNKLYIAHPRPMNMIVTSLGERYKISHGKSVKEGYQ